MLFFGECTLNFKHRSFQSLPVKRQVRRLQKKSGVISGKKSNIPWWKPRDLNNKESRMFRLFRDWPSRTFKEAFTGFNPLLLEKNIYMAWPDRGLDICPTSQGCPLRLAPPYITDRQFMTFEASKMKNPDMSWCISLLGDAVIDLLHHLPWASTQTRHQKSCAVYLLRGRKLKEDPGILESSNLNLQMIT